MRTDFFRIFKNASDISLNLKDYFTDGEDVTLQTSDFLYVGFRKKFNTFYVELSALNTVSNNLVIEYYDSEQSNWVAFSSTNLVDETRGFTESGFVYFEKPKYWAANEVNSITNYYIRISPSANHNAGTIKGLGILFSNDKDLIAVKSNIVSRFNNGNSWITKHENARKDIIQKLRNMGNRKYNENTTSNPLVSPSLLFKNITEFDILEPFELRNAAKYKVLSDIYKYELSDQQGDKYERNADLYEQEYLSALELILLSVDEDDDGELDDFESLEEGGRLVKR